MAKLLFDDASGRRETEIREQAVLGREPQCEVMVDGPSVSRRHAQITSRDGEWDIEDLGSSNGTFVNDQRITSAKLHNGDKVRLGSSELTFVVAEKRPATTIVRRALNANPPKTDAAPAIEPTVIDTVDVGRGEMPDGDVPDVADAEQLRTRLKVLHEVAESSCGSLEIDELVEAILNQLLQVFPQADHAHAILFGLAGNQMDLRVSARRPERDTAEADISRTLVDMATGQRKAVLTRDVGADDRFSAAQSILTQRLSSMMCSPLVVGPRVLGAIQVDTTGAGRPFDQDDLRLLVAVAGQVAVATENARLHREVVAKQRLAAIGEAISSIAHCMKNVLQAQQSGSYILDLGLQKGDPNHVTKGWGMVKRNNDFMFGLVKDMLAYCRKGEPTREACDFGEMLAESMAMVEESATQKGIDASLSVGQTVTLEADVTGLKRVLLNLLTNSIDACDKGAKLEIIAGPTPDGKSYAIAVQDTGPGIPEEVQARLFEPFFTTKGSKGTGLGLALVKKVMTEHGGDVRLESTVGQGTAFHLTFPLPQSDTQTART